ncbi:hypothetical protein ElyMa_005177300 [Elysia marginata]|uniref:CS domain-containing protein n=1 Tax=Elysia marginata TaxID=1093978 RepID=A0AAV4JS19_9GAST|nr:hypothetical protein ElyMa_005177300 [Elysia marginata]
MLRRPGIMGMSDCVLLSSKQITGSASIDRWVSNLASHQGRRSPREDLDLIMALLWLVMVFLASVIQLEFNFVVFLLVILCSLWSRGKHALRRVKNIGFAYISCDRFFEVTEAHTGLQGLPLVRDGQVSGCWCLADCTGLDSAGHARQGSATTPTSSDRHNGNQQFTVSAELEQMVLLTVIERDDNSAWPDLIKSPTDKNQASQKVKKR